VTAIRHINYARMLRVFWPEPWRCCRGDKKLMCVPQSTSRELMSRWILMWLIPMIYFSSIMSLRLCWLTETY